MQLYVPRAFWTDYSARFDEGTPTAVRYTDQRVLIEGTPAEFAHFHADAVFYADDSMDACPSYLRRSATATLAALKKVFDTPPDMP